MRVKRETKKLSISLKISFNEILATAGLLDRSHPSEKSRRFILIRWKSEIRRGANPRNCHFNFSTDNNNKKKRKTIAILSISNHCAANNNNKADFNGEQFKGTGTSTLLLLLGTALDQKYNF